MEDEHVKIRYSLIAHWIGMDWVVIFGIIHSLMYE